MKLRWTVLMLSTDWYALDALVLNEVPLTGKFRVQSHLAYPILFHPDPSPSGRKSLVTDLQHKPFTPTVCVFD